MLQKTKKYTTCPSLGSVRRTVFQLFTETFRESLLVVFIVTPSKLEMGNERRYIFKKPCQEPGLCNISCAMYSGKRFTQIYKALETPCLCPFQGHKYGRRKPTETSVFEFSYFCVNSSLEELIKIKVIFILRQGMFRQQNLPKSVTFLIHVRAFLAVS